MGLIVLDASLVIAMLDVTDALHDAAAQAVRAVGHARLVLPASALAEVMVGAHRTGRAAEVRDVLRDLGMEIEPLSDPMADAAARMRARHAGMRLPDALVLGTAMVLDADRILTGDRRWAAWSDIVEVIER